MSWVLHFSVLATFLRNNLTETICLCNFLARPLQSNGMNFNSDDDDDDLTEIIAMLGMIKKRKDFTAKMIMSVLLHVLISILVPS
jgi:hypothetical protein